MVEKRRIKDLLPKYLQTETLTKVFSSTADHLFQPADLDFLSGYVGNKPSWYNSQKDFYIPEPDKARDNYQLSPTVVSKSVSNNQVTQALHYEDLLGSLRFQGANIDNHNRLFSAEYYSWSPPIDIDKFVNFSNYYWLTAGPDAIILLDQTDLVNDLQSNSSYTYTGAYQYSSNKDIVSGNLVFTNGLKITLTKDLTQELNGSDFYITGVGDNVSLIYISPDRDPSWDIKGWATTGWDGQDTLRDQYFTISRGSLDNNQWSQSNKWFHIDVVSISKTYLFDPSQDQADRPIIEFDANIELYKYGTVNRGTIDVADSITSDFLGSFVGQSSCSIDGIVMQDNMTVLVTGDKNSAVNGRIYKITGITLGAVEFVSSANGDDTTGAAIKGDRVDILFGSYQAKNMFFDGTDWISTGQQKPGDTAPLFQLYDIDGNAMDDPSIYPNSTFTGNSVFAYKPSSSAVFDNELGINAQLNEFGDYIFDNSIATEIVKYSSDLAIVSYNGYMFARIIKLTNDEYINGWYKAPMNSRQYIVNEFDITSTTYNVDIDQIPADQVSNTLPNLIVTKLNADFTSTMLVTDIDYQLMGATVVFINPIEAGNRLVIQSWNPETPVALTGYYELPKNLTANPNNLPVTTLSRGQFLQHFVEIIQNQTDLVGKALGSNNYRDTYKERGLGLSILQHRAPLIKTAILNSTPFSDLSVTNSNIDPMTSMQFAQRSYQRFYNRFLQTLFLMVSKSSVLPAYVPDGCDPYNVTQLLARVLKQTNLGKSMNSPWANSGPDGIPGRYCVDISSEPTYVPPTATRLGLAPAYKPVVYIDTLRSTAPLTIQTHDGSRIVMVNESGLQLGNILHNQLSTTNPTQLTNPVAAAWLQFENNLFNSLPTRYKDIDAELAFDTRTYSPGKWRSSDYSRDAMIALQRGPFDKWVISNQIDYEVHSNFDIIDQFTFNYSNITDLQGNTIPGYWQGIYRWFYDTDRPNTHPWEMLGFSQKPTWWETEYGPSPYTNGNTALWEDLRDGVIRFGPRAGIQTSWARPGLISCIPVDDQGALLPPFLAGTVASIPSTYDAQSEWKFGDGAPVETTWIHSQDYNFIIAELGYLMKPAAFIEYTWDILRTKQIYSDTKYSQWIYEDTNSRRSSDKFYIHRETPISLVSTLVPSESTLSYFGSGGIQHWISEYLISQSLSVTKYFGSLIRGGDVQLSHRMAGYINSDTFRGLVDSFGDVGYGTRLLPSENINVYLYKSSSISENFYSGIIVEQATDGWKVYGYDSISPIFKILPPNTKGPKTNVVIGNQRVTEYSKALPNSVSIPYGTMFNSRQDVYDFIISHGRWLTSQGWSFAEFDTASNTVVDWTSSAREFLFWSQGTWANGTFIALSPSADHVTFTQSHGNIQYVNGIVSGTYPILDRAGTPIQPQNINVVRDENNVTVRATNAQGVFGLRLFTTTLEHIVFFDNKTAFNDIIYDPLYNLQQQRIQIYCYRANGWTGRVDAPGFILIQDSTSNTWTMTSNFEKTVDDVNKFFNIDEPKTYSEINPVTGAITSTQSTLANIDRRDIDKLSKHMIGYQSRQYLQNLLLEDATEFEFYQGFIRQKGTKAVIDSLLRNTAILPTGSTFEYYEEWLLRLGYYGATSLNNNIEFRLLQSKIVADPQWIRLFSQNLSNQRKQPVFDIVPHDPLIVNPPESYPTDLFQLRQTFVPNSKTDLPTAGYAMLGDTTWHVANKNALLSLYTAQKSTITPLKERDTVWQFITDAGDWRIWILTAALGQIDTTVSSEDTSQPTYITTTSPHGLLPGDICVIYGVGNVPQIDGTYEIFNVTPSSFQISLSTYTAGSRGTIKVYRPMRFTTTFIRDASEPPGGWANGDLVYVDQGGIEIGAWTIYRRHNNAWLPFRQQNYKVDVDLISESLLYNSDSNHHVSRINYFDPVKGKISGQADREISYKTNYDPAKYNKGNATGFAVSDTESWGNAQLGLVWWDLSTVRYIDYEQGDESYRIQQWGKLAPGTNIDVYEWVRSPISPASWAEYVAQSAVVNDGNNSYIPTGTVKNQNSPNWTELVEIVNGTAVIYYYFWVANSGLAPSIANRQLTTDNIANLIANPSASNIPWFAAISDRSIIVSGVQKYLNSNKIVMRIDYKAQLNDQNIYGEWQLVRDGDAYSPVNDIFWNKMKDSLTGQVLRGDVTGIGINDDVPDYHLNDINKRGNSIRPRQSWFVDRAAASKLFIDTFNTMLSTNITPLIDNSSMVNWITYFSLKDPIPTQSGNWNFRVVDLSQRDGLIGSIGSGQYVLVDPTIVTGNVWTIWKYSDNSPTWTLTRQQSYNTENYWQYVDWYVAGYGPSTIIQALVNIISDLNSLDPTIGYVAKVLNNGNNKWQLYAYLTNGWTLVGYQDATIEILSSVYDWVTAFAGFDGQPFDSTPFDQTATIELSNIIDGIRYAIYSTPNNIELNKLFFAMINYVVAEQGYVDWVLKTSNIVLKGFNEPLLQSTLLSPDYTNSILGFIAEAKPYHAKIREFITGKTASDISGVAISDFDVPPGYLGDVLVAPGISSGDTIDLAYAQGNKTLLIENEDAQRQITINVDPSMITPILDIEGALDRAFDNTFASWYNNYQTHANLVRHMKIQIIFDRVITSEGQNGWGITWNNSPWDILNSQVFEGAYRRISNYYLPDYGMPPKDIDTLIGGAEYRGVILSALDLNLGIGWGVAPWDHQFGFDADQQAIDDYLDFIVQGGIIPKYDMAIGNGIIESFSLTKGSGNPNDMIVWADSNIKKYGPEWIVPASAISAVVINGGTGYLPGEILEILAGTYTTLASVIVTGVSTGGVITSVEIFDIGDYSVVSNGPYYCQYPYAEPGLGSGLTLDINWTCETIKFSTPPISSLTSNIYILYVGTTFEPAPISISDTIFEGNKFIQPNVDDNHPEEQFPIAIKDGFMMDVYSKSSGGRPLLYTSVYQTDNIKTVFDLPIIPQSDDALIAYLNGNLLKVGPLNDYVINFNEKRLVLLTPAPTGILSVTSISVGGSSRELNAVTISTHGIGYSPGDVITLTGPSVNVQPTITVDFVCAVGTTIISGGTGYKTGDRLILNGIISGDDTVVLEVTSAVYVTGRITAIRIFNIGSVSVKPVSTTWLTTRTFNINNVDANISIRWGALSAQVTTPGLYKRIPAQPITQASVTPSGGTGAKWLLAFTGDYQQFGFVQTDQTEYELSNTGNITASQLLVNVDGDIVGNVSVVGTTVSLTPTPNYGESIEITKFDNNLFSTVVDTELTISNASVLTYSLTQAPLHTNPAYLTTMVRKNGDLLPPPVMKQIVGDGFRTEFQNIVISGNTFVYVDQVLNGISSNIVGTTITFSSPPPNQADIQIVNVDPTIDYQINSSNITFSSGSITVNDIIHITTFSEDIDYEFHTEEYNGNSKFLYMLTKKPYDGSVIVWLNNKLLSHGVDYIITPVDVLDGWNAHSWDIFGWDLDSHPSFGIQLGSEPSYLTDKLVITYMVGLPYKPAISWRTISANETLVSTALDFNRMTTLLSDLYTNSGKIEIADYTVLTRPMRNNPGAVWIDYELVYFTQFEFAPTGSHPNRAFLSGIQRARMNTSSEPRAIFNTLFYNGDEVTIHFAAEAVGTVINTTVWIDNTLLTFGTDYIFVNDPLALPAGHYVKFITIPPPIGYRNVKVISLKIDSLNTYISHKIGTDVIDAGDEVKFDYKWEPTLIGLQYNDSSQSEFLLDHAVIKG